MNEEKKALKQKYIPLFAEGEISERECAEIIGITTRSVSTLKNRFLNEGYNCFEHKNKGRKSPNKKHSSEEEKFIVDLYSSEYENTEFRKFARILKEKYNISYSDSSLTQLLKKHNIESPLILKYKGSDKENESSFFLFFEELRNALGYDGHTTLPDIDISIHTGEVEASKMYGAFFLCECLYNSAFLALAKIIREEKNIKLRTAHSVFTYCIENNYLDIADEWEYWNENHKYFTLSYDKKIRENVFFDVHEVYFQMFYKIYDFLSERKQYKQNPQK